MINSPHILSVPLETSSGTGGERERERDDDRGVNDRMREGAEEGERE